MSAETDGVKSARRYYLLKRLAACAEGESALASVWRAKQEAEPGTLLLETFPSQATLEAAGYTTVEDLDGASTEELAELGLSSNQIDAIIAALAPLL